MADHLLPPTSTSLEKAMSLVMARILDTPVPIDRLWNPQTCPANLLPWLAWTFSVDVWSSAWDEQTKRDVISASPAVHRLKGTPGALKRAVVAVWNGAEVEEWFEYGGDPYKFRVRAGLINKGFTEDDWNLIIKVVFAAKNVRSHLDTISLRFDQNSRAPLIGAALVSSNEVEVLPRLPDDLSQQAAVPRLAAFLSTVQSIEILPQVN